TFAMEKGWLTVGLALMVPGIAWIAAQRPLPFLRSLAAVIVALVMARIAWEPRIVGIEVGATPIFNWLLYGYGVPALAFWVGRTHSSVHDAGAVIVAGLALAGIVFGLMIGENPLVTGRPVGGALFNLILLGYGVPALLAIILALIARTTRPMPYRAAAAATS